MKSLTQGYTATKWQSQIISKKFTSSAPEGTLVAALEGRRPSLSCCLCLGQALLSQPPVSPRP